MPQLRAKIALVTGASRGLGRDIALVLAEKGCDLVVNYRSSEKEANVVAKEIQDMGRRQLWYMRMSARNRR